MTRTSMHPQSGDPRPAPQHAVRASHSAHGLAAGGGREYAPSLHELIHASRIDDRERRAMRARAKFTWAITDIRSEAPACRMSAHIASPLHWRLTAGPKRM